MMAPLVEVLDVVLEQAVHLAGGDVGPEGLANHGVGVVFDRADAGNQVVIDH